MVILDAPDRRAAESHVHPFWFGLGCFCATGLIVASGLSFGGDYVKPKEQNAFRYSQGGDPYANWDGQWYEAIADRGYSYDPKGFSSVAFFPAFPILGRAVSRATGLDVGESLLAVSNVCFLVTLFLIDFYCRLRYPTEPRSLARHAILALCLLPNSYFFRLAYSESLFIMLAALVLVGIELRWAPAGVAAIIGAATATRSVGVGLIPALLFSVWRHSPSTAAFLRKSLYIVPLSCWGLAAFLAFLGWRFGAPLAFIEAQSYLRFHSEASAAVKFGELLTLEPVWGQFVANPPAISDRSVGLIRHFIETRMIDRLSFLLTAFFIVLGAKRRWLNPCEWIASACLLLIPYVTVGYGSYMNSMGRYAAAVVPAYLVVGRLLCRVSGPTVATLAGMSGLALGLYSALFSAWYSVF